MSQLTGRIRHRIESIKRITVENYLVLQVEYKYLTPQDLWITSWRDATVEDLTTMDISSLTQVRH